MRCSLQGQRYFNFSGFSETAGRDTDPNPMSPVSEESGQKCPGNRSMVSYRCAALCAVSALRAFGRLCGTVRRTGRVRCIAGSHYRGATLRLRRRNGSFIAAMACLGNEHGICGGIYDHRSGDQDHQSGRAEDRAGAEKICALSGLCNFALSGDRTCGGQDFMKRRKIQFNYLDQE